MVHLNYAALQGWSLTSGFTMSPFSCAANANLATSGLASLTDPNLLKTRTQIMAPEHCREEKHHEPPPPGFFFNAFFTINVRLNRKRLLVIQISKIQISKIRSLCTSCYSDVSPSAPHWFGTQASPSPLTHWFHRL